MSFNLWKKFMYDVKKFFWDQPYFSRVAPMGLFMVVYRKLRCLSVLEEFQSSPVGFYNSGFRTVHKILQFSYYQTTIQQDAHEFAKACDRCHRDGGISRKQELPLNPILVFEVFDVWGIDFMDPFVTSHWMKYILVAFSYVSKWVKAIELASK